MCIGIVKTKYSKHTFLTKPQALKLLCEISLKANVATDEGNGQNET